MGEEEDFESGQGQEVNDLGTAPESNEPSQGSNEHSMAQEFLESIEDQTQRMLLEPKIKDWDSRVTKKFQEIHGQYQPYKELGADPDTLQKAYGLYQQISQSPQQVLMALAQAQGLDLSGYQQFLQSRQQPQQQPVQGQPTNPEDPYKDYPEPVRQQFTRYDTQLAEAQRKIDELNQIAGQLAQDRQMREQTEQKARVNFEIDQKIGQLKKKYGEFNEQSVLLNLYRMGKPNPTDQDWDNAVQIYRNELQQYAAKMTPPPAPRVMGGGGTAPPQQQFNPLEASNEDTKKFVAGLLSQAQGS